MSELACLDGHIAPAAETFVPATDEGLLRGDGVFEVMRVYGGAPFALSDHLTRMQQSAANLRLPEPDTELLRSEVTELIRRRDDAYDGCVRVLLTRGGRRPGLTEPLSPSSRARSTRPGAGGF